MKKIGGQIDALILKQAKLGESPLSVNEVKDLIITKKAFVERMVDNVSDLYDQMFGNKYGETSVENRKKIAAAVMEELNIGDIVEESLSKEASFSDKVMATIAKVTANFE